MNREIIQPKRKRLRLKDYDYSAEGAYFITICTRNMEGLFGKVQEEKMLLNKPGKMIDNWWNELEHKYDVVVLDEYIVMPNHLHGIIMIVGPDLCVRLENKIKPVT